MTREPVLPAQRAAVFAAVCLGLAVAAHRMMSGAAIPAWAVVFGALGVYAPARFGTRRERGLAEITLLMVALQVALHLLFGYAQDAAASMPGMPMPPGTVMPATASGGGMRMGSGMLLGHAAAALVCAWWLRRGEASLHALIRGTTRWVLDRIVAVGRMVPVACRVLVLGRVEPIALALHAQWLRTTRASRGPPQTPSFA